MVSPVRTGRATVAPECVWIASGADFDAMDALDSEISQLGLCRAVKIEVGLAGVTGGSDSRLRSGDHLLGYVPIDFVAAAADCRAEPGLEPSRGHRQLGKGTSNDAFDESSPSGVDRGNYTFAAADDRDAVGGDNGESQTRGLGPESVGTTARALIRSYDRGGMTLLQPCDSTGYLREMLQHFVAGRLGRAGCSAREPNAESPAFTTPISNAAGAQDRRFVFPDHAPDASTVAATSSLE